MRRMDSKIQCENCKNSLRIVGSEDNLPSQLINQKNCLNKVGSGGLCQNVLEILLYTEKLIRLNVKKGTNPKPLQIISNVVEAKSDAFPPRECNYVGIENHQLHLIRLITASYIYIRFKKIAKDMSLEKIGRRQKLHRAIIFENL